MLDAVGVGVEPDAVADGAGVLVAEVDVGAVGPGGEGEAGLVGRGDAVEVVGLRGPGGERGGDDLHGVGAAGQVVEGVVAVAAGGGGGDHVVAAVEQLDG